MRHPALKMSTSNAESREVLIIHMTLKRIIVISVDNISFRALLSCFMRRTKRKQNIRMKHVAEICNGTVVTRHVMNMTHCADAFYCGFILY